jgi:hypothetical protein
LAHPKVRVLLKRPFTKNLESDHQFQINAKYENQARRIRIPLMAPLALPKQQEEFDKQEQERHRLVDVAILRETKGLKSVRHEQLIIAVMSQVKNRFRPNVRFIKERIEALIDQEYITRDKEDQALYRYLA